MNTQNMTPNSGNSSLSFSSRDLIAIGFRHKRPIIITFCAIVLGAVLAMIVQPAEYQASTKFLIERARMDPIVSAGQDASRLIRTDVAEEELNSEVELLQSEDVLRQVVVASGLEKRWTLLSSLGIQSNEQTRIAKAVARLQKELQIEPVKKSNLIVVSYASRNRN